MLFHDWSKKLKVEIAKKAIGVFSINNKSNQRVRHGAYRAALSSYFHQNTSVCSTAAAG
jgi:hypothetical protein